jgi:hypothetical protein
MFQRKKIVVENNRKRKMSEDFTLPDTKRNK